jgi:hypothetical protein
MFIKLYNLDGTYQETYNDPSLVHFTQQQFEHNTNPSSGMKKYFDLIALC